MSSSPFDLAALARRFWVDNALETVVPPLDLVPEPGMHYFVVFGEPGDDVLRIDLEPVTFTDDEGQGWQCICGYDGIIFVTTQKERIPA